MDQHDDNSARCAICSKPLVNQGAFCAFCGTKIIPSSTISAIDAYVQDKVNLALSGRLKDQSSLVRELGDKAEDIVWKRINRIHRHTWRAHCCLFRLRRFRWDKDPR